MATLSLDLRKRIVRACDRGEQTRQEIADRFEVSLGMVKKLLSQRKRTGDIDNRHRFSGRKAKIGAAHQQELKRLLRAQPDLTLAELRDAIGVECTPQAIHYALGRMGFSLKKSRSARKN